MELSKFFFAQSQVEYIGHLVSHKGVKPVASKVEAIHQWPVPQSTKALWSFLGLVGFYHRFIRGYFTIAAPLVKTTTLEHFQWATQAQTTFEQLKQALSEAPILALPDFQLPFTMETDASSVGMGVVLVNHEDFDDVKKNLLDKGGECESCISWRCQKEITWLSSSKRGRMWMYEYMNFDDAKEESNKVASKDKHLL